MLKKRMFLAAVVGALAACVAAQMTSEKPDRKLLKTALVKRRLSMQLGAQQLIKQPYSCSTSRDQDAG